MHGAHRSRNVLKGIYHPRYKNGERSKAVEAEHRRVSTALLTLRDIGDYLNMFTGSHTRGRRPTGYKKFNMNNSEELANAILKTFNCNKVDK